MSYVFPNYDACDVDFTGDTAYVVRAWDAADATFNEDDPEVIVAADSPLGAELILLTASFAVFVAADSPLGDPAMLLSNTNLRVAADSPLGAPSVLLTVPQYVIVAADSPLGSLSLLFNSESGDTLQSLQPEFYAIDVTTPDGMTRFQVSSWTASLEVDKASYVGVVVPSATSEVLEVLDAMTSFRLLRYAEVSVGVSIEVDVALAVSGLSVQSDSGPTNNTATVAGYTADDAYPSNDDPDSIFDRPLVGVRSVSVFSNGQRVRSSIDWLLKPGVRASYTGGGELIATRISYTANTIDRYMDVSELLS